MEMQKKITIHDIAEKANVSISTVSRVLNNNQRVAEEKRQAVLRVIAELNYKPNLFAQGLAGGQSRTIGVLTQNVGSHFYDVILRGIMKGIEGSHFIPIFADGKWQASQEIQALQTFLRRQVDGLIVLGGSAPHDYLFEIAQQVPLIVIGRDIPTLAAQCLRLDDFEAAYRATQYLIECGHRNIAHITGLLAHQDAVNRRDGYRQALLDAGIEPDPQLIIEGEFLEASGIMAVEMLFARGRMFSAIFAANDQMAYGARLGLYRRGLRVPEDISLVGFDNLDSSAYMTPPLTSVQRPPLEIGELAARALLHLMNGENFTLPVYHSTLAIRESVARR